MADAGSWLAAGRLCLALVLVLWLPGWVAVRCTRVGRGSVDRLAIATGLSVALWPVAMLWTSLVGLPWTSRSVWTCVGVLLIGALLLALRDRRSWRPTARLAELKVAELAVVGLTVLAFVGRWWQAHNLVAAPWVDGYHHTLITQLMIEQQGLPHTFEPYLHVDRFFYHFGFHTLAALVAILSGVGVPAAVLWTGQAMSALTVPAVFVLTRRMVASPMAAVLAAAVPAGLYLFPAYYLSWGRYTQLAGLVLLPTAWLLALAPMTRVTTSHGRRWPVIVAAAVSAAALVLVHYRVAVGFAIGVAVFGVAGAFTTPRRGRLIGHIGLVAMLGLLVAAPWLGRVIGVGVGTLQAASATWFTGPSEVGDVPAWLFTTDYSGLWLRLAAMGLLAAVLARRRWALPAALTLLLMVLIASPVALGLPSSWILPAFAVAIAAWLPVSVGLSYLADCLLSVGTARGRVGSRSTVALGLVAVLLGIAWAWRDRSVVIGLDQPWDLAIGLGCSAGLAVAVRQSTLPRTPRLARRTQAALAAGIVMLSVVAAWQGRDVLNAGLVLLQPADVDAAAWVRTNTPAGATFLVRTGMWQLGTYRGLDGGYWLTVLTGRHTTMPAIFYNYGAKDYGLAVADLARQVTDAGALDEAGLTRLMRDAGAEYIYLGPASSEHSGGLTDEHLAAMSQLERVYAADGVTIFRLKSLPDGATSP